MSRFSGKGNSMAELFIQTHHSCELLDITEQINARIPETLVCGICHIYCPHTTAGLTVNENADPDVRHDLLVKLERLIPHHEPFYQHCEGNSDAHLKAMLTGFSLAVPVVNGALRLGTWQGVYFCEYDGPRSRRVQLYFQTAEQ